MIPVFKVFSSKYTIPNFTKTLTVGFELILANWWTDRQNKTNRRLSRVCERVYKVAMRRDGRRKKERRRQKTDMLRNSLSDIGKKGGRKIRIYKTYVTVYHAGLSPDYIYISTDGSNGISV